MGGHLYAKEESALSRIVTLDFATKRDLKFPTDCQ